MNQRHRHRSRDQRQFTRPRYTTELPPRRVPSGEAEARAQREREAGIRIRVGDPVIVRGEIVIGRDGR